MSSSKARPEKQTRLMKPNGATGTGRKSSGKRTRCLMPKCQAFESPAKSGYCVTHELEHLAVGEKPAVLRTRKCKSVSIDCTGFCAPAKKDEDEPEFCDACSQALHEDAANRFFMEEL